METSYKAYFSTTLGKRPSYENFCSRRPSKMDCHIFDAHRECCRVADLILAGHCTSQQMLSALENILKILKDSQAPPILPFDHYPSSRFTTTKDSAVVYRPRTKKGNRNSK